ncbi:MAG: high frequency lysogenization protein HflD, partial [Euzebyales bacterium]|nr:high frequency lysogenization protein HflD [Euzebyales bacterium]
MVLLASSGRGAHPRPAPRRPRACRLGLTARRGLLVAATAALAVVLLAGPAAAHPLGYFTTNAAAGITVSQRNVTITHVTDLAEIPALQARQDMDAGGGGVDAGERSAFRKATCAQIADRLRLTVDGRPAALQVRGSAMASPPGQAGLRTLRLTCHLRADIATVTGPTRIALHDGSWPERIGWREVTAVGDGVAVTASDVPAVSPSDRLRTYPR